MEQFVNRTREEKNNRLLTLEETASFLDVPVDTIRNWANKGILPALSIGRSFEKRVDNPHGFYDDPLNDRELEHKFETMATKYMDRKQIQQIFDVVWKLEDLKNISDLTSLMVWQDK